MIYDLAVIGAGSAGCVIASRLSENPKRKVILIESGADYGSLNTPSVVSGSNPFATFERSDLIHDGLMARMTSRSARQRYLRGRGVGGSSAINLMIALNGLDDDYNIWESEFGCKGWNASRIRDASLRLLTQTSLFERDQWSPLERAFIDAAIDSGIPPINDSDEATVGAGPIRLNFANGRRFSVNDAYLEPARARGNFSILANSDVVRIRANDAQIGIELTDGSIIKAREVCISAGTVHSPCILWSSGINIPGIGARIKDHVGISFAVELKDDARIAPTENLPVRSLIRTSSTNGSADLQFMAAGHLGVGQAQYGALFAALMQVESTGQIIFNDETPMRPNINVNALAVQNDQNRMIEAARKLIDLAYSNNVRLVSKNIFCDDSGMPAANLSALDDAELLDWLLENVSDYVHLTGSCRMGTPDDSSTVVDSNCRVHGVSNLRIVDASIFPEIPRANTHMPTVLVAEAMASSWD